MSSDGSRRGLAPGLLVVGACAAAGFALARVAPFSLLGPLVLALVLAAAWRALALRGRPLGRYAAGAAVAAGPLLKLGIVALGVRLDVRSVVELGPWLLAGSALGAVAAFATAEAVGRAWRVPPDLRRAAGIGTAICGASAIAAAAPLLRASPAHASASIGAISLLGTLGVLGFVAWDALAVVGTEALGRLAGATLQEVGQVVAAGSIRGPDGADAALLVKLSRVVLLAPALVALAWFAGRADAAAAVAGAGRRRLVPPFVLGFLAMGAAASAGLLGAPVVTVVSGAGTLLTAAAMAGIGANLDARALRGPGRAALTVGAASFLALLAVMIAFYALVT